MRDSSLIKEKHGLLYTSRTSKDRFSPKLDFQTGKFQRIIISRPRDLFEYVFRIQMRDSSLIKEKHGLLYTSKTSKDRFSTKIDFKTGKFQRIIISRPRDISEYVFRIQMRDSSLIK